MLAITGLTLILWTSAWMLSVSLETKRLLPVLVLAAAICGGYVFRRVDGGHRGMSTTAGSPMSSPRPKPLC